MTAASRHKTRMQSIADEMIASVADGDLVVAFEHRTLNSGLGIVLQRNASAWRLALARDEGQPTDHEIRACRQAFAVPASAAVERARRPTYHESTGKQTVLQIAEISWHAEPLQ